LLAVGSATRVSVALGAALGKLPLFEASSGALRIE
jgi:hypothetical protein